MRKLLSAAGIAVLMLLAVSTPILAIVKANDVVTVEDDEVINDDFFATGSQVIIKGKINGDVYVGADRLEVKGVVNGDVIAGANTIVITGKIRDDLRVAGNTINLIGASIGDSVSVGGNELSVDEDSKIGGGLLFGGRLLVLDGSVGRGVTSGSETANIDGPVGRTVRAAANTVTIGENAVIDGDLEYNSDNKAVIDGKVNGEIVHSDGFQVSAEAFLRWATLAFNVWAYLASLVIGGALLLLFPKMYRKTYSRFAKKPWPTIGYGTLFLLAAGPALGILAITVVGIPLAIVGFLLVLLAVLFAKFFTGFAVGNYLLMSLKRNDKNYHPAAFGALFVGLTLYYILRMAPFIGIFVRLITTIVGVSIMLTLYRRPKKSEQS